jgi:membrane-bound serine protease (ClpP class)
VTADLWPLYIGAIVAGIVMLGAEIYLPGGILGVLGVIALIGAMAIGFFIDPRFGFLSAAAIVVLSAIGLYVWVRVFPKTGAGRKLTLTADSRAFSAVSDDGASLVGRVGVADTALRPGGIATVDGRRVDVIAIGVWVEAGSRIRVDAVQGSRIEVSAVSAESGS